MADSGNPDSQKKAGPSRKPMRFKPAVGLVKAPDVAPPAETRTDITAAAVAPEEVLEVAATTVAPVVSKPSMFGQKPRPVPMNTTRRLNKKPVPAVASAPEATAPVKAPEQVPEQAPVKAPEQVPEQAPVPEAPVPEAPVPEPVVAVEPAPTQAKVFRKPKFIQKSLLPDLGTAEKQILESIKQSIDESPYTEKTAPEPYFPEDREGFTRYIGLRFRTFRLPPPLTDKINPNACSEMKLQTYLYQAFVREYMRQASPYRGILVYHGLGSGKTCTSIATAEALYSQDKKRIIVMTPIALKENFINEIMFCGFKHYRLKNFWTPLSLENPTIKLFAENILGISSSYIQKLMMLPPEKRVVWMPDFSKSDEESNYDSLPDDKRTAIRNQLYNAIGNRITLIGYTGTTIADLADIALNKPDFFDDAVIVIDEVHNLTRLMTDNLDRLLADPTKIMGAKKTVKEGDYERLLQKIDRITPGPWVPKIAMETPYPGDESSYDTKAAYDKASKAYRTELRDKAKAIYNRAYFFYRFLACAKNSKIVALSGTPIVNHPVEIGIMANILHGYFNTGKIMIDTHNDVTIQRCKDILKMNRRVDFYKSEKKQRGTELFFTILDEGYIKIFDETTNKLKGVLYVGLEEARPSTIEELAEQLAIEIKALRINIINEPSVDAIPLMPPLKQDFDEIFINAKTLGLNHEDAFIRRMSGLVSYYRGSKEELMPKVVKDEVVPCTLSGLALQQYDAARQQEIDLDKKSKKQDPNDMDESQSASYRFKSRAICNFAFPKDMDRPYPSKRSDFKKAVSSTKQDAVDGVDITEQNAEEVKQAEALQERVEEEDEEQEQVQEQEEKPVEEEKPLEAKTAFKRPVIKKTAVAATGATATTATAPKKSEEDYDVRLRRALDELRAKKDMYFQMDASAPPENQLSTYSSKFAEIYKRILESPGSSLVYSNFKNVEGIDTLGLALEANGFAIIKLKNATELTEESVQSLTLNPAQPRYILYSGEDTVEERQTLINIFNCRIDKLPSKIAQVIRSQGLDATGNRKGEICKVFMITGAGAEGLSLRNVRTVHIMEPFWNKVRTDQVKGRAVRICSHADLPYSENPAENQRTVEVYTYVAKIDPKAEVSYTVKFNDSDEKGNLITSDEYIKNLAEVKDIINQAVQNLMKSAAVDCMLNKMENEKDIRCVVQKPNINEFLYDPRIQEDITGKTHETESEDASRLGQVIAVGRQQIPRIVEDVSDDLKIYYELTDIFGENPLGELRRNPKGRWVEVPYTQQPVADK
jgi:hypothetical protein